jgi:hypothetical protein
MATLCAVAAACTGSDSRAPAGETKDFYAIGRDTTAATQTDSLFYRVTVRDSVFYDAPAMVTFRNTSADTAYFVNCNGAIATSIQRKIDDAWVDVWNSEQDQCLSAPIVVPPGDTLRRRVLLFDGFHPHPNDTLPPPPTDPPPAYRLMWRGLVHHYRAGVPFGTDPALALQISNPFLLAGAPR